MKPADGAVGGHANAVADCRADFLRLARAIAERAGVRFGEHVAEPLRGGTGSG